MVHNIVLKTKCVHLVKYQPNVHIISISFVSFQEKFKSVEKKRNSVAYLIFDKLTLSSKTFASQEMKTSPPWLFTIAFMLLRPYP